MNRNALSNTFWGLFPLQSFNTEFILPVQLLAACKNYKNFSGVFL
jgi:hypothetical protein